jgi:hypothetical protein
METFTSATFDKGQVEVVYECMLSDSEGGGWYADDYCQTLTEAKKWYKELSDEDRKRAVVDVTVNLLTSKMDDGVAEDGDVLYRLQILPNLNAKINGKMSKSHKCKFTVPVIVKHNPDSTIKVVGDDV